MYPSASIASFPRSVQSTRSPSTLWPCCLAHPAFTIKSSASEIYSSGVLDSFGIGEGKHFPQYFLALNFDGRTIWVVDAHRDDGKRFVVHADKKLTAFVELESATRSVPSCLDSQARFFQTWRR